MTCLAADDVWPMRSMLFVPGHKLDWIRKASRYKLDALIIDLEDAVPPSEKAAARLATREGIAHCHSTGLPATVRINSPAVGGLEDIEAIASPGLTAVVVPKLRTVDEVQLVDRALAYAEGRAGLPFGSVSIVLIPETAAGLRDAGQLAAASPRVKSIMGVVQCWRRGRYCRCSWLQADRRRSRAALPGIETRPRQPGGRRPVPGLRHRRHQNRRPRNGANTGKSRTAVWLYRVRAHSSISCSCG